MADLSGTGGRNRMVTAFFDTQAMAQKATDDLVAAGFSESDIRVTRGAGTTAIDEQPIASEHKGFWAELKDLFLPDPDRHSYAEGLTRGGHLLSLQVDDAQYNRVLDILDADGAVDMDAREADWRAAGWSGFEAERGGATDQKPAEDRLRATLASPVPTTEPATASSLGFESPPDRGMTTSARDLDHGRTRLRSYTLDAQNGKREAVDVSPAVSAPMSVEAVAVAASAQQISRIAPHMDVIASDGISIGTVDHLDGPEQVKLTLNASSDGQHRVVPVAWIDHVDTQVHLNRTSDAVRSAW